MIRLDQRPRSVEAGRLKYMYVHRLKEENLWSVARVLAIACGYWDELLYRQLLFSFLLYTSVIMGRWVWEFDLFKKLGVMGNLTLLFLSIAKACYSSNAYQIVHIHVVCIDTPSTTYSGLKSFVFQLLLLCTICSPKFVFLLHFFLQFGPSLSCIHWWSWIHKCITYAPAIMLSRWSWSAARLTCH